MKRGASMTLKQIRELGYVEYEPDKFAPAASVQEISKSDRKVSKNVSKKSKSVRKIPKIDLFAKLCEIELKICPVPEYKFHPERKWRMDYAFPDQKIFLEVEGGVWSGGRHTRGKGFIADMEKYNAAAALGWTLIRFVPDEIDNQPGKVIDMIKKTMKL